MSLHYGLTKPQKLIYDTEQFAGGAISVVCGSVLRMGNCNNAKMHFAVNKLLQINDALRTRIVVEDGIVYQTYLDYQEEEIEVLRFSDKKELDNYGSQIAKVPFDICGSLSKFLIVVLPDCYGVILKLHHIIGDGWAFSLLAKQFFALIDDDTPPAYPYAEYVASENTYLHSKRYEADRDFFLKQFQRCDKVTYLSEKQIDSFASERMTFLIDKEQAKIIYDYGNAHNLSPFMLFLTALSIYVRRIKINTDQFYIGTPVLNRAGVHEKNTVGMYANTVPLLIELNNDSTFFENLTSVANAAFGALRHQKFHYGDVLAAISKAYGFSKCLYDVHISYQNAKIVVNGDTISTWYPNGMQSESLQIHIEDRDNKDVFRIHYDYQLEKYTEAEIKQLHQHISTLLFDGLAHDWKQLHELDILTNAGFASIASI